MYPRLPHLRAPAEIGSGPCVCPFTRLTRCLHAHARRLRSSTSCCARASTMRCTAAQAQAVMRPRQSRPTTRAYPRTATRRAFLRSTAASRTTGVQRAWGRARGAGGSAALGGWRSCVDARAVHACVRIGGSACDVMPQLGPVDGYSANAPLPPPLPGAATRMRTPWRTNVSSYWARAARPSKSSRRAPCASVRCLQTPVCPSALHPTRP